MKNETFVHTEVKTRASDELAKEVADEVNRPNPTTEQSKAAFREALKDKDQDGQE